MFPCPFCDFEGTPDMQSLVHHVLAEHRDERVAGIRIHFGPGICWVACWCERLYSTNPNGNLSLAHHWQQCGGLAAHILEIVLFKKGTR